MNMKSNFNTCLQRVRCYNAYVDASDSWPKKNHIITFYKQIIIMLYSSTTNKKNAVLLHT